MERIWEPWQPAPGTRVRVRRSAECRSSHHIRDGSDDGLTGVVIAGTRPPVAEHPYTVLWDQPIPTGVARPALITGMRYAAAELEPEAARCPNCGGPTTRAPCPVCDGETGKPKDATCGGSGVWVYCRACYWNY